MDLKKVHLLVDRPGYASLIVEELKERWNLNAQSVGPAAAAIADKEALPALTDMVFVRQLLPRATNIEGNDTDAVLATIVKRLEVTANRPNRQKGRWTLHAFAIDDDPATARAAKLEKALLATIKNEISRLHKRYVEPVEFAASATTTDDFVIQVYCIGSDSVWFSVASLAEGISPLIGGAQRMRHRSGSPSRSSNKLEEAFVVLGRSPSEGETAVDLGAAPGGWTFTLARHGALVTAIDHAALDLPENKQLIERVEHLHENGLKYRSAATVDWLCCDMVIGSLETLRVLREWLEADLMRQFVVNVKLPQDQPWPVIQEALVLMETFKKAGWSTLKAKHLYHDRREITLMGSR